MGADERRSQFVAATISALARNGYQNVSMAVVANEAGLSKGLLWHYFDSGEDLMEEAARVTVAKLRETVASGIDVSAPVPQVIRAAIKRAAGLRVSHGVELRAVREIVQNLRKPDGSPRMGLKQLYEETYMLQAALFERGQNEGSLRPDLNPRCISVTYQGAVDAMLAYLDSYPDADAEAHAAAVAEILLNGLATSQHHKRSCGQAP